MTCSLAHTSSSWRLFIICFLITESRISASPSILFKCSDSNFATNSTYRSNLNRVLSALATAGWQNGFSLTTQGHAPNQVFGRSLCLGYLDPSECQSCLLNGLDAIKNNCPRSKRAGLWYDYCLLRYSDTNTTSSDEKSWLESTLYDVSDIPNPEEFQALYAQVMGSLALRAANSTQMFQVGEAKYAGSITVYGLVQCVRDLLPDECYTCLQQYISSFQPTSFYWGKQGFSLAGFQCYMRTDITPYFNLSLIDATQPVMDPPPLQPDPHSITPSPPKEGTDTIESLHQIQ